MRHLHKQAVLQQLCSNGRVHHTSVGKPTALSEVEEKIITWCNTSFQGREKDFSKGGPQIYINGSAFN